MEQENNDKRDRNQNAQKKGQTAPLGPLSSMETDGAADGARPSPPDSGPTRTGMDGDIFSRGWISIGPLDHLEVVDTCQGVFCRPASVSWVFIANRTGVRMWQWDSPWCRR